MKEEESVVEGQPVEERKEKWAFIAQEVAHYDYGCYMCAFFTKELTPTELVLTLLMSKEKNKPPLEFSKQEYNLDFPARPLTGESNIKITIKKWKGCDQPKPICLFNNGLHPLYEDFTPTQLENHDQFIDNPSMNILNHLCYQVENPLSIGGSLLTSKDFASFTQEKGWEEKIQKLGLKKENILILTK